MNTFYNENFWKRLIIAVVSSIFALSLCEIVHAEELPENDTEEIEFNGEVEPILSAYNLSSIDLNSLEDDEKLTAIETRLNELGYAIEEIDGVLQIVQTSELAEEEERLAISEKLDVVIIGLNELCSTQSDYLESFNEYKEYIEMRDIEESENETEFREAVLAGVSAVAEISSKQAENTVSGNRLTSALNDTMKSNGESTKKSIETYGVYILIFIAIVAGMVAGSILSRYIKHD